MKPAANSHYAFNAHVFHDEESNDFKGTTVIEHHIPVGDAQPMRRPQYRTPYALRDEMEQHVQKMLQKGVIRPGSSLWSAPAILVPNQILIKYTLRQNSGGQPGRGAGAYDPFLEHFLHLLLHFVS